MTKIETGSMVSIAEKLADISTAVVLVTVDQLGTRFNDERMLLEAIKDKNMRRAVELLLEHRLLAGRHQGLEFALYDTDMQPTEHEERAKEMYPRGGIIQNG